ncbi:MAG: patatin family protein [Bacteroidales bacterium]|nr:patatin family protein [Bacteroidales bacterium]
MENKINIAKTALVLEGGGMRGVFTAGVLDYLMDNNLWFPYTIGVSAGASNGISYACHQRGRAKFSDIDLLKIRPYIGFKHFIKGKGYIDLDYIFYEYPNKLYPLDFDALKDSPNKFVMVASNCITGEAMYFDEKISEKRITTICRASCSLPILCPLTIVDGIPMVDGGVCDAIPYKKALLDGYEKLVIVLTRNKGYRKSDKIRKLPKFIYKNYPAIREKLADRGIRYNKYIEEIELLEQQGKAVVIRPEKPIEVSRTEKDIVKLNSLYQEGYDMAKKALSNRV